MKIIISPSKTQKEVETIKYEKSSNFNFPKNDSIAIKINEIIKKEINLCNKDIWKQLEIKNNQKLEFQTSKNVNEFKKFHAPSIMVYDGLQFKNLAYKDLEKSEQKFLNENLLILSAYYGFVKPNELISNYRLMMNSKIEINKIELKDFWKENVSNYLKELNESILNLASNEYSYVADKSMLSVIDVYFYIKKNGKLTNLATNSKTCRGKLIHLIAKQKNLDLTKIKKINVCDHLYDEKLSHKNKLVFVRQ